MQLKKYLFLVVALVSLSYVQAEIIPGTENTEQTLIIQSQTGIDSYINWEVIELSPNTFLMTGTISGNLWNDFWIIRNLNANRREWTDFINNYFPGETVNTIRTQLINLVGYPVTNNTDYLVNIISITATQTEGIIELSVNLPRGKNDTKENHRIGWNSTVISAGLADSAYSDFNNGPLYSKNFDRWFFPIINTASDPALYSANSTLGNISLAVVLETTTTTGRMLDCAMVEPNATHSYIHCVHGQSAVQTIRYTMLNVTSTNPFVVANTMQTPYTSAASADDFESVGITVNNESCPYIIANFEDDSEVTADEFEIFFFRKNSSYDCLGGAWNSTMTYGGGPIESVQEIDVGYNQLSPVGVRTYGDSDAMLAYMDTDTAGTIPLNVIFYNGSTHTMGTQITINPDIEFVGGSWSGGAMAVSGDDSIFFYVRDAGSTLTASSISTKNGAIITNVTGFFPVQMGNLNGANGTRFSAQVDTRASSGAAPLIAGYTSGTAAAPSFNWSTAANLTPTSWGLNNSIENATLQGSTSLRHFELGYDNESCNGVAQFIYQNATASYYTITNLFNTGNCAGTTPATTTYINCASNPTISTNTDYNGTTVYFNGTGTVTIRANLTNTTMYIRQNGCSIVVNRLSGGYLER